MKNEIGARIHLSPLKFQEEKNHRLAGYSLTFWLFLFWFKVTCPYSQTEFRDQQCKQIQSTYSFYYVKSMKC